MSAAGLGDRWRTPVGQAMAEEAVARLGSGSSLNGIGLGSYEGRVDLRELSVPVPARLRRFESQGWFVEVLGDLVVFRGARLEGLDLSGAQLQSLRFSAFREARQASTSSLERTLKVKPLRLCVSKGWTRQPSISTRCPAAASKAATICFHGPSSGGSWWRSSRRI